MRFGLVGTFGFLVDVSVVLSLLAFGADVYTAGLAGWLVAASVTWFLNRLLTFLGADRSRPLRQWLRFLASQTLGFVLNRGTYALLVTFLADAAEQPALAVAAGSCAGLAANFLAARRFAFRTP